ncbi:MAG TPA: hypothetical protein VIS74_02840 [Chthoniobacterales bacterium]
MSGRVNAAPLVQAGRDLLLEWEQVRERWSDANRREFEKQFLAELPLEIARVAEVVAEIDVILRKVRNDCE